MSAEKLSPGNNGQMHIPTIGVFATGDPRIDADSRSRAVNIIQMVADALAEDLVLPDGSGVPVVYSDILVDGEEQADQVAQQFKERGVDILVCAPDTWAFPQLTAISLLSHFPKDTPINFTCGNSGPRPGVVFTHAMSGAISQYGGLIHINVGDWPDTGQYPEMSDATRRDMVNWAYAAVTYQGLKGRRIVVFGHDSMGMETALPHVAATRNTFGLEITRLDMKLLADMVRKEAYDQTELDELRNWLGKHAEDRIELRDDADEERLRQSLSMYLIVRDLMDDLNAVGGGFMSQLEWGSDKRGTPLPVADIMESLFNSTFDHRGEKPPLPFATEADVQAILTMLIMQYQTGGNPPLFMDFRKGWEPWEIQDLCETKAIDFPEDQQWAKRGFVDGCNSGSASFNWAGKPGDSVEELLSRIAFPLADDLYFPGLGNSVTFISPGGIQGVAARLAYSSLSGMFSMVWDEAETVDLPEDLAAAIAENSDPTWPHTFITPRYATMTEYKQYAPANHFHMMWGLSPARLQYWMDLANVFSVTPWQQRTRFREGVDRPLPLLYLLNGGEEQAKLMRKG